MTNAGTLLICAHADNAHYVIVNINQRLHRATLVIHTSKLEILAVLTPTARYAEYHDDGLKIAYFAEKTEAGSILLLCIWVLSSYL
jgi:hypothetical protein